MASSANGAEDEPVDKKKEAEPLLTFSRYLGFRAASEVTAESDYNFTLLADGTWTYKPLVGGEESKGALGDGLAAWKKKLAKTGLAEVKEPKGGGLAIADAPQATIVWSDGGKSRTIKLAPSHKAATAVHELIQALRKKPEKEE
jgi:hypothetical protein